METINKLLKKQAPKGKGKAGGGDGGDDDAPGSGSRPNPVFVRWVSSRNGTVVGVPTEMLDGPAGDVFGGPSRVGPGGLRPLVEEVP
jgi:Ino eighty subunit 2